MDPLPWLGPGIRRQYEHVRSTRSGGDDHGLARAELHLSRFEVRHDHDETSDQ
jgi:hypothetical protein